MAIDWFKYAILASRVCLCVCLIAYGIDTAFESGERNYNKYLHSLRKMQLEKSKPTEPSPSPGMTWNDLNLVIIQVLGGLLIGAGAMNLIGQKFVSALLIIQASLLMAASKDNPWLKSDVAAINREKDMRMEWFVTDVSLIGVALIFIGGMGSQFTKSK